MSAKFSALPLLDYWMLINLQEQIKFTKLN